MPLIISAPKHQLAPQGNHRALCNMVCDLGIQETLYGPKQQVYLRFELSDEMMDWETSEGEKKRFPMVVGRSYTATLGKKSSLLHDLESWRGHVFTPQELDGFELFNVLGKPCLLNVIHNNDAASGKIYANIANISPLPKGMDVPTPFNPLVKFGPDDREDWDKLPDWLKQKIAPDQSSDDVASESVEFNDDIPF